MSRHRHGKSDELDAHSAAEAVRTGQRISPVKNLTILVSLRASHVLRTSAMKQRTQVGNELHQLARPMGLELAKSLTPAKVTDLLDHPILGLGAQRWLALHDEIREHNKAIAAWLNTHAPELLTHSGVGPDSATRLVLAAGGNPDRLTNDATFAHLTGVAPVPCLFRPTPTHATPPRR